jgi:acylphosphatase
MTGGPSTVHVRIQGLVQGVGYRAWTERVAIGLGLVGWVRNRRDGSVEAVFQGDETVVADMIERCKRGPSAAQVREVAMLAAEGAGVFHSFEVRETA